MAIRVSYTPYKAIGQLAKLAGESIAERRGAERRERLAGMAYRAAEAQRARQQQKEMLRFRADLSLKTQQQAHVWEMQKLQIRSQNDFELTELRHKMRKMQDIEEEMKDRAEYKAARKTVEKATDLTERQKQEALRNLDLQHYGYRGLPQQREQSPLEQMMAQYNVPAETMEQPTESPTIPEPKSETELNALPSGTLFRDPVGKLRRKV